MFLTHKTRTAVERLCVSAMIAALYTVFTLILGAFSFGPVQFRLSEALTLLPVLLPEAVPGLAVGCFLSNLFNPLGTTVYDLVFGTAATLLAAVLTRCLRGRTWLAAVPPVACNALVVSAVLTWGYGLNVYWMNLLTVGAGEAVICFGLGIPMIHMLRHILEKANQ